MEKHKNRQFDNLDVNKNFSKRLGRSVYKSKLLAQFFHKYITYLWQRLGLSPQNTRLQKR